MIDFRTNLYKHYVSTFKKDQMLNSDSELLSYWKWCEDKYLPLLLGVHPNAAILELGCGPGYMMDFLRMQGFSQVQGIDISEEQVALAKSRSLNVQVADVIPFLSSIANQFDVIMAIDFIEHFAKDELFTLLPYIRIALKERGRLILQTPNGQGLFPNQIIYGDLTHITIFNPSSLAQLLSIYGFQSIGFKETGPAAIGFKGRTRAISWSFIKQVANTVRRLETGKTQDIWTENMICFCHRS